MKASDLPKTRHGCTCNKCHWCTWESSPIKAIKILLRASVANAERMEGVKANQRSFYAAEKYKGKGEAAGELLRWIEDMEKAEATNEGI